MPLVGTLPYPLTNGTPQDGSEVFADIEAVRAVVDGGIDAANVSPTAALPGTVISNTPGSQIPTDRLADNCVTAAKLYADASAGSPAAAVNSADHIKDGIITREKLAFSGDPTTALGADSLKIGHYSEACNVVFGATPLRELTYGAGHSSSDVDDRRRTYFGTVNATMLGLHATDAYSLIWPLHAWIESVAARTETGTEAKQLQFVINEADENLYFYLSLTNYGGTPTALDQFVLHFLYIERLT